MFHSEEDIIIYMGPSGLLTVNRQGNNYSKQHTCIFKSFLQKMDFDITGDNLHVMSKPIFWENK